MDVAMLGLGRMGANMARRLLRGGHRVVLWNRTYERAVELARESAGAPGADGGRAEAVRELADVPRALPAPRSVWLMLPHGAPTDAAIDTLVPHLEAGDVVIDGGNSFYKDDIARAERLAQYGIRYLDVGTSGGVWGLEQGYCLMVGGERVAFEQAEALLRTLAPAGGYVHAGGSGAGHFVKMVHNGIEYGLMQAYAEGFEILRAAPWPLDLAAIAAVWNQGSVVRSWLLELVADAFRKDADLAGIEGYVEDTGEGRWTVSQAIEAAVPAPVIALSLFARFRSRQPDSFGARVLAALRNEFGGHAVRVREGGPDGAS
jgi:6-phosphogluconate dehydrogenase